MRTDKQWFPPQGSAMKKSLLLNGFIIPAAAGILFLTACAMTPSTQDTMLRAAGEGHSEADWVEIAEGPMRLLSSPDDAYLYVLRDSGQQGHMQILNGETYKVLKQIPVGGRPIAMAIEGRRGYVVNNHSDDVTVVDLEALEIVNTIPVGKRPIRITASANSRYVLVTNYGSDSISIIDKISLERIKTLPSGSRPGDVAFHPDGQSAYVLFRGSGEIARVDMRSLEVTHQASLGEFPSGMAISDDGNRLFVSDAHSHTLRVIETKGFKTIREVAVGQYPVQVMHAGGKIHVLNRFSKDISVIDPHYPEEVVNISLENRPRCMTASSDGSRLFISYGESHGEITMVKMENGRPAASQALSVTQTKG